MKTSLVVLLIVCIICASKTEADDTTISLPKSPGQDAAATPDVSRGCSKANHCNPGTTAPGEPAQTSKN